SGRSRAAAGTCPRIGNQESEVRDQGRRRFPWRRIERRDRSIRSGAGGRSRAAIVGAAGSLGDCVRPYPLKTYGAPEGAVLVLRKGRLLLGRFGGRGRRGRRGRGRRGRGRRRGGRRRLQELLEAEALAALHDRDRLDLPVLQREDRDLGVLAVALL